MARVEQRMSDFGHVAAKPCDPRNRSRDSTICVTICIMTRREVLVQLDDHLVENLDVLARELGLSRSELLRRGAQAILDADALKKADRRLQSSYQSLPQDEAIIEAAARLARETTPLW